eukprot:6175602-Pleurochrysis_carterae.AAC.1
MTVTWCATVFERAHDHVPILHTARDVVASRRTPDQDTLLLSPRGRKRGGEHCRDVMDTGDVPHDGATWGRGWTYVPLTRRSRSEGRCGHSTTYQCSPGSPLTQSLKEWALRPRVVASLAPPFS